jgi:non-heme chloroperoxidase
MRIPLAAAMLLLSLAVFAADPAVESRRVKTDDGAEIHYLASGPTNSTLPPILFVPGYLMPGDIFEFQLRHFAKSRRVAAIDPRSQGKSARISHGHYAARRARDIKAVAEDLGWKNFVLAGWSLAVSEVLSFHEQFGSEKLQALILIDGDLSYEVADEEALREIQFLKFAAGATQRNRAETLRAFVRGMYHLPPPAEHLERVTASVLATSEDTSLALLVHRLGFTVGDGLEKIRVPTLVILAEQNRNKERVLRDASRIPKANIRVFKDAGHALFVDRPDEFNELLERFLAGKADSPK